MNLRERILGPKPRLPPEAIEAYHEAAHAVVAWVLGDTVRLLTLRGILRSDGTLIEGAGACVATDDSLNPVAVEQHPERYARVAAAGGCLDGLCGFDPDEAELHLDRLRFALACGPDSATQEQALDDVTRIVLANLELIQRVGDALAERRELDQGAFEALVRMRAGA